MQVGAIAVIASVGTCTLIIVIVLFSIFSNSSDEPSTDLPPFSGGVVNDGQPIVIDYNHAAREVC